MAHNPLTSVTTFFNTLAKSVSAFAGRVARGFEREWRGESNVIEVPTVVVSPSTGAWFPAVKNAPSRDNVLEFEQNKTVIAGGAVAVHRVRCLDGMIGSLTRPFNGVARVPDDVVAKINAHIGDVASSVRKVTAYTGLDQKEPVAALTYVNTYTNDNGEKVQQVIACLKPGQ